MCIMSTPWQDQNLHHRPHRWTQIPNWSHGGQLRRISTRWCVLHPVGSEATSAELCRRQENCQCCWPKSRSSHRHSHPPWRNPFNFRRRAFQRHFSWRLRIATVLFVWACFYRSKQVLLSQTRCWGLLDRFPSQDSGRISDILIPVVVEIHEVETKLAGLSTSNPQSSIYNCPVRSLEVPISLHWLLSLTVAICATTTGLQCFRKSITVPRFDNAFMCIRICSTYSLKNRRRELPHWYEITYYFLSLSY